MLGAVRSSLPILTWLPNYRLSWLSADAIAGFTIWGLLIPEMIAYASLAGLPPEAGLYTLLASLTLYAVLEPAGSWWWRAPRPRRC